MTTVADALSGVTRLGLDTAPFIYLIETHPEYDSRVTAVFAAISEGRIVGVTSVISLIELLSHPLRSANASLYLRYRDLLLDSEHFEMLHVDVAVADRAALLRAEHGFRVPDAIQLAAAMEARCDVFLTNDLSLKRARDIPVLVLGEMEP